MSNDYGWGGSDPYGGTPYLTDEDVARAQINANTFRYPSKLNETWPFRAGRALSGAGRAIFGALSVPAGEQQPAFGTQSPQEEAELPTNAVDRVVGGMGKQIAAGVTAPSDALAGKITSDDDMFKRAWDVANVAAMGAIPSVVKGGEKALFGSLGGAGHNGGPPMGGNPGGFYSQAARAVENEPAVTRTAEEWGGWLRNKEVKAAELTSLGLNPDAINPGLRGQKLDKDTLLAHINENTPKFKETVLGDKTPVTLEQLKEERPEAFDLLQAHGLEPDISPSGRNIAFHHVESGDLLTPREFGSDFPIEARNAADSVAASFQKLRGGQNGAGPTQYADYTGIPGAMGVDTDPAYRERTMQLQRAPRDEVRPDALAQRKYQKSWDDLTVKIQAAQERINQARRDMSPDFAQAVDDHAKLDNLRDQIHDRMVDDTYQRKPYWQNRGMQYGSDDIDRLVQERHAVDRARYPGIVKDSLDQYSPEERLGLYDSARNNAMPHGRGAPTTFTAPHFGGYNEDLLFHLRDTDGTMVGEPGLVVRNNRIEVAVQPKTHHVEEAQADMLQRLRDKGYQLPPQPPPTIAEAMQKSGARVEEVPNYVPPETKEALDRKMIDSAYGGKEGVERYALSAAKTRLARGRVLSRDRAEELWNSYPASRQEELLQSERDNAYGTAPHLMDSAGHAALANGDITADELRQWKYARENPLPFRAAFGDQIDTYHPTRAAAEADIINHAFEDAHGIYRLPEGTKRFEPGQPDPGPRKKDLDGKPKPAEALQTHAVQLPQSYRGKSLFYGESAEEAEGNALAHMQGSYNSQIPDAPFKNTWHELALKKAVLDAVAKGKDAVSWWPGEVHGQRYGFEHRVEELRYNPSTGTLGVLPKAGQRGGGAWQSHQIKPEDLADYVGQEHAAKLNAPVANPRPNMETIANEYSHWLTESGLPRMSVDELEMEMAAHVHNLRREGYTAENSTAVRQFQELKDFQRRFYALDERNGERGVPYNSLTGDQLRMTSKKGQGQRGFYNDMMVRAANTLFKKYGVKMERGTVSTAGGTGEAHILRITPQLREAVQKEGLSLFQGGVPLPMNNGSNQNGQ